jgi:hypothetical protein
MPKLANKSAFLNAIKSISRGNNIVTRAQCVEAANSIGMKYPPSWFVQDKTRSCGRGLFYIDTTLAKQTKIAPMPKPIATNTANNDAVMYTLAASSNGDRTTLIPETNKDYVPFGHYDDVLKVIQSEMFAPMVLTGNTGTGKTEMIEQICAKLNRECLRVNFTDDAHGVVWISSTLLLRTVPPVNRRDCAGVDGRTASVVLEPLGSEDQQIGRKRDQFVRSRIRHRTHFTLLFSEDAWRENIGPRGNVAYARLAEQRVVLLVIPPPVSRDVIGVKGGR